tara:strand:+ start:518 stop:670 length:153 start_codon:yes stop_codon:yes gene_type:complete
MLQEPSRNVEKLVLLIMAIAARKRRKPLGELYNSLGVDWLEENGLLVTPT